MNNKQGMAKRIMAMMLVLTMMLTTVGGYAPGWFKAFAEETGAEEQLQENSAPVQAQEAGPKQEEPPAEAQPVETQEVTGAEAQSAEAQEATGVEAQPAEAQDVTGAEAQPVEAQDVTDAEAQSAEAQEVTDAEAQPAEAQDVTGAEAQPVQVQEVTDAEAQPAESQEETGAEAQPAEPQEVTDTEAQPVEKQEATPAEEEASVEEANVVKEPVAEEETQQQEADVVEEPAAEEEEQQEADAVEEPAAEEEEQQEADAVEEPAAEEEEQQEEADAVEEPVVEEEQQEEADAVEEPVAEEEEQQEKDDSAEEPAVEEDAQQEATPIIEETPVHEENEAPAAATEAEQAAQTVPEATDQPNTAAQLMTVAPRMLGIASNAAANVVVPDLSAAASDEPEAVPAAQPRSEAPQADEPEEIVEAPAFTMATAPAMASAANGASGETQTPSALQTLIDNAMKAVTGKLTGQLKVVLAKDANYEGEVKIEKGDRDVAEDFELELITEDAGDDGLQSEGKATFKGNMVVKGINLIIRGLGIPGKVSVEGAKLAYYGSKAADTVNVQVGKGASADIQTGAEADAVTVTAINGGAVKIDTGADGDTVSLSLSNNSTAEISTGAGGDNVKVVSESGGSASIETGEGGDTVDVDAQAGTGNIEVDAGSGDDAVNVVNSGKAVTASPKAQISVDLGSGLDEANVNLNLADAVRKVIVKGGDDSDRLHITGTLNADKSQSERITGTEANMTLQGATNALNLVSEGIETYTDDLKNKRTVKLTPTDSGKIENYIAETPFTNYVINAPSGDLKSVVIKTKDGKALALSGVIIETDTAVDGENKLLIKEGTTVDVRGLKLVLKARNIEVNGTLKADQVQIEALDGTGMYTRNFADQYAAHKGAIPVPGLNEAAAAASAGIDMLWDMVNINDEATIVIGEKAAVYASGDVMLLARVEQTGGLITLLPNVNLVNVKVAKASVDIAGKVYAGYDFATGKVGTGFGTVKADAQVNTTMGYDSNGKMTDGQPLAVSVGVVDAHMNVAQSAVIEAAKDISLNSRADLKVATRSDSGFGNAPGMVQRALGGAPFAIAVAVLVSDVHTKVDGTLKAGGDVQVTATGNLDARSIADRGEAQKSVSGGYVAVSVAVQDVKAELGEHAKVTAAGSVKVASTANEKVDNRATAGAQSSEPEKKEKSLGGETAKAVAGLLKEKLWPKIKAYIHSESAQKKLEKQIDKIASSDHSIKVDEDAERKGVVKVLSTDPDGTVKVQVTPWEGYSVKYVEVRGYNPGDARYQSMGFDAYDFDDEDVFSFKSKWKNVTVFVEYEEIEGYEEIEPTAADLFDDKEAEEEVDLQKLIDDATSGTDDTNATEDAIREIEENTNIKLTLNNRDEGSILTYETKADSDECLDKVAPGDALRLIPNPAEGKKLKEGGLKVTYYVKEDDKQVRKTVVVTPDAKGRYIFTVPEGVDDYFGISVMAEFEDVDPDKDADESQTQATGAIAVVVSDNDNDAVVDAGAQVTAGSVTVDAKANTNIANLADGTAVSKEDASEKKEADDLAIKRPDAKEYSGFQTEAGRTYGLILDATENGSVEAVKDKDSRYYTYSFTAKPEKGYSVASALLIYYQGGERKTAKLALKDGKYSVDLSASDFKMDQGSTAVVSFAFAKENTYGEVVSSQAAQAIIPNPIRLSYNSLKKEGANEAQRGATGTVSYTVSTVDGKTSYLFTAKPNSGKGYVLDGGLKASWLNASGATETIELTKNKAGQWVLDAANVPDGAPITVSAAFKEDFHAFKVDTSNTKDGTVTLHDEKLKNADKPKITVKPNAGFSLGDVTVTYMSSNGIKRTIKLNDTNSRIEKAKDAKGNELKDVYTFEVPDLAADSEISVSASFNRKTIGLYAGDGDKAKDYTLSEKNVATGDKVTVTISDEKKLKAGYKVTGVTVTDASGKTVVSSKEASFTVPGETAGDAKLTVKATLALKEIAIEEAKLENGSLKAEIARADRGEKVKVTVSPADNFKVRKGTLRAVIKASDGSYTEEVVMTRVNDKTYTFEMPATIEDPSKVTVSFTGEFEPGQSDSSAVDTSLGAGIAVTVSNSENNADVKGTVASSGNIKVNAEGTNSVKTETKAGYSKGNIGVGGAISVQVASMDSKARVHSGADLKLDGVLSVNAANTLTYTVNADASGGKKAEKAGVGAGIAVAVNGSDTVSAVQDGAKLAVRTAGGKLKGVSVTAKSKAKDAVGAKAGAAGGTSVVPVAAVDVIGTTASAYLGNTSAGKLTLSGDVALSATVDAAHTVSADASAAGKGAGIGIAAAVSVVSDEARAQLNESVEANGVTVATETVSNVTETATASASGGKSSGKSADQQADGLLGGAAKLSEKNKSGGLDAGKLDKVMKDRQKAETSEGTVGVAGAVAVNVQSSSARSEIMDGVNVKAADLIGVTSVNGTTAQVKGNASVTNSDVGVGVGVAVNIVALENIARLGDGKFEAAMLKLSATTKETTPEKKASGSNKVEDEDGLARQLGDLVEEYVNDLVKEMGLDKCGVSEDLLGELLNPVVTQITNELINATGLKEFFGDGDLSAKYEKAKKTLLDAKDGLMSLPEKLIAPFMDAVGDVTDLSKLSSEDWERIEDALIDEFINQLKKQLPATGEAILSGVKDGMMEYLTDHVGDIFSGVFSGKFTEKKDEVLKQAREEIAKAAKKELLKLVKNLFADTLLNVEIPGVTQENADAVAEAFGALKDAWKEKSVDGILTDAMGYVTDTFKKEVFDYEAMLSSLSKGDFKKRIIDGIKSAAKKGSVALTDGALAALSSHFDLALEAQEEKATGHVIDTQAVSGAGTREVGVAGSVAVTVLNAETSATVAGGSNELNVTGDLSVEANELRSVKSVASAALDAKGNADANKSEDKKANKDVAAGDGSVANNTVSLKVGPGASAKILQGDMTDKQPKIYVTLQEGYKMPEGNKASFAYTDTTGMTVLGEVALTQDGDQWVLDTKSGDLDTDSIDLDKGISLELKPVEVLNKVARPTVDLSDVSVEEGAVTVSIKDREANDDGTVSAHAGETVQIRIARKDGRRVAGMGYSWKDSEGNTHDVEFEKAGKKNAFTLASSNEKEYIYTFAMPDGEITDILVVFEKADEEDAGESRTTAKDDKGTTVGVGAAFSMVYGDVSVKAQIDRLIVKAGSLSVKAAADHKEDIASAAGSDPLEGELDTNATKDFSLDASVALNLLDNAITAAVKAADTTVSKGDLTVEAAENAITQTTTSAFSVGGETAIGASVALNIASSAVNAEMAGSATVAGSASVRANSHSEDVTKAIATAMGADIGRNLAKLGEKVDNLEEKSGKLLDGSYIDAIGKKDGKKDDKKDDKKENKTASLINDKLDMKKQADGKESSNSASTSTNALRTLGVKIEGTEELEELETLENKIKSTTGQDVDANEEEESTSWQVAAAVGVTISDHAAKVSIGSIAAGKAISAEARNTGNFNTLGTGAAMSLADHANAIAAGVAVSWNDNAAQVEANGSLTSSGKEAISLTSKLTQNLDGDFAGKLAAQGLSGSVAGKSSNVAIAGAIGFVHSTATSTVDVAGGNSKIEGGDITVEATDKSKLTSRAGGLSISRGSSLGMGIAASGVVSGNTVRAALGDNVSVTGNSLKLNAEKLAVTWDDYKNLIGKSYFITDSSKLSKEQREKANTGLIDMHKGEGENNYQIKVNLTSDKLLEAVDGLNFLSAQNTYVEAIAGSVMTGDHKEGSKLNLSGSFAVAWTDNTVSAELGRNVKVTLNKDMKVNAANGATSRVIAGSLSAAPSKAGVGATVAFLKDRDVVTAESGDGLEVDALGSFSHNAESTGDIQVFTGAMSVAYSENAKFSVGGAINGIVTQNKTESKLGNSARIKAGGDANVTAKTDMDLMVISGSASVTTTSGVAAGGTVNFVYDEAVSLAQLGNNNAIEAGKNVTVRSEVDDRILSGAATLSVAAAGKNGKAGAGVINAIIASSAADTVVGAGANLNARSGDLKLNAANDAWMLNATVALSGAKEQALGAGFNLNLTDRKARLSLTDGTLNAGENLYAQASGVETDIIAGLALAGSTSKGVLSGNLTVLDEDNVIKTTIARGVTATAGNSAVFESYGSDYLVEAAGSIAAAKGNAFGATVVMVNKNNEIITDLAASNVTARANGSAVKSLSGENAHGVYVGANAAQTQFVGAAGIAASGDKALNGVVSAMANENTVIADASRAALNSYADSFDESRAKGRLYQQSWSLGKGIVYTPIALEKIVYWDNIWYALNDQATTLQKIRSREALNELITVKTGGDITVTAKDDSRQLLLAGGVNASSGSGVGASVVGLLSGKTVKALAHDMEAHGNVAVTADSADNITVLAVSAGGSGKTAVELGATVADMSNKVNAIVASRVQSHTGGFSLTANNTTDLIGVAVAVGGAGQNAVSPVFAYTGFTGETNAVLESGTVEAAMNATVKANSAKTIDQFTVGAAFAGKTALSGAVSIVTMKDQTNAITAAGTSLNAGWIDLEAGSDAKLLGASAAVAASGSTAAAVNGMVNIVKAATLAELGGEAVTTAGAVNVKAHAKRDVVDLAATVAASGQTAAGITVMALVAGDRMDQDTADQLTYGSGGRDNGEKTFDASGMLDKLDELGIRTKNMKDMPDDVQGDGKNMDTHVGSDGKFDVASGYTADGVYNGGDGETAKAEETQDVKNAKNIGASARSEDPLDSVTARIAGGSTVRAQGVNVEAKQETLADLFGATVGAGGSIGGGLSFAMALMRSNVIAASLGTIDAQLRDVNVNAISQSGEAVINRGSKEEQRMIGTIRALGDKLNPTKRSIWAIGLAVGAGGEAGAAIAAGVVRTDNVTSATLGGAVSNVRNATVNSDHKYQNVLAATLGLAGGSEAGIAASIAGVAANGTVSAKLDDNAVISGTQPNVSVTTDSVVNADTVALSAAVGGGAGVAAGISFVRNELTQNTSVNRGVLVSNGGSGNGGSLTVKGKSVTTGNSLLMGLSGGIAGVGIGVGVVNVKPTMNTTLGVNGSGTTTLSNLGDVKVLNDVSSKAGASVLSASAGAAGIGANVLLVFNDTNATAKAANATGSVNSFAIDGQLDAAGSSDVLALAAGAAAVGVNVNYVDVNSANTAELDAASFDPTIAGRLSVTAGDATGTRTTSAQTQSVTGTAGAVALGVNVSIARNRATNDAIITGRDLNAASVILGSYGKGTAKADMTGVSVGAIKLTASVVDALNETTNRARMNLTGKLNGSLQAQSQVEGETTAKLTTGGGSLVGVDVNVATAYGKTNAVTDVSIGGSAGGKQSIAAKASGRDTVTTDIDNLIGLSAVSVATMVGAAHAQDVYSARVKLTGGDYRAEGVTVNTDSDITSRSTVTPSSSGINVSAGSLGVNVSSATSTAYAGSELVLDNATLTADKDVDVRTETSTRAEAVVKPATFSLSAIVDVGVNKVTSDLKGIQAATLRLIRGEIAGADSVNVQSLVKAADSRATVSTSGVDSANKDRVKLGAISGETNTALAKESLASTAAVIGERKNFTTVYYNVFYRSSGNWYTSISEEDYERRMQDPEWAARYYCVRVEDQYERTTYDANRISANALNVMAGTASDDTVTGAKAYTQGANQAGFYTAGNLDGQAYSQESVNAVFSGATANVARKANVTARGNAQAVGEGTMPGSLALVNKGLSTMKAGVGTEAARQTVKVLIGTGAVLNAGEIAIDARNTGNAVSSVQRGTTVALGSVDKSSQPTDSWYDTGVVLSDGVKLMATAGSPRRGLPENSGDISIYSVAVHNASSTVSGASIGIALNLNSMRGENTIHDENNIDIGRDARIQTVIPDGVDETAKGDMRVFVNTTTRANARTDMTGGGIIESTTVKAFNNITRNARINIAKDARILAGGNIRLHLNNGLDDNIHTEARVVTDGALALGNAEAVTTLNANTELHVASGTRIIGGRLVRLQAMGGSRRNNGECGIETQAVVKANGGGINPVAIARTVLNVTNYVDVNRRANSGTAQDRVTIRSETGTVNLWATNDYTHVLTHSNADGKAGAGRSLAKVVYALNLQNTVWVDDANLEAPKSKVLLEADNGDFYRAYIEAHPLGELYAAGGSVSSDIEWSGTCFNQIRTNDRSAVKTAGSFIHERIAPNSGMGIHFGQSQNINRAFITTVNASEVIGSVSYASRCDFCGAGTGRDVAVSARANTGNPFAKALSPLMDIQRMLEMLGISKARYGEEDYAAASAIFVLDLAVMLEKDVTLNNEQIGKYRLWTNAETQLDAFLLPNATRMYARVRNNMILLQYVAEVIRGDVRGNGESHEIDIITALTPWAVNHPVIPVGSAGSLDFSTGTLTIPSEADFELYLHEVSGEWLIGKLQEGFIRRLSGDQDKINEAVMNGTELPNGVIVEGLIEGGEKDGWQVYWLGDTPDTATDADEVLIGLLVDPDTDEVDAFRTSVNMIESGEDPVDVSLYLYRDSKSDRNRVEKYNCMFFDTSEGEKSLVKVITDVLMGRELEMPLPLEIVLRDYQIAGADWPVYSLTDHFFALCDGVDGNVSMFDGFYTNTFDGDTFESDYIRIEGIVDGDLNVTVKEGQPIWPEWTGENTATDIASRDYTRLDGVWQAAGPLPEDAASA